MAEEFGTFPLAQGFIALTGMLLQEFEHNVDPPHLQYRLAPVQHGNVLDAVVCQGTPLLWPAEIEEWPAATVSAKGRHLAVGDDYLPHCGHRLGELATGAIAH